MRKNFDNWNNKKKKINEENFLDLFFHEREIWWCSLGLNKGVLLEKLATLTKIFLTGYEKSSKVYFDDFYCLPS